jgi:tRNA(fMet)-specific endonuclease VapC
MQYLLDTNAVIALLNDPQGAMAQRVRALMPVDFGLSSIVMHELYFSAFKSQRREHSSALVDGLRFEILALDREDARHAGDIRAQLASQGTPIGGYDLLIAGQARARGLTLITRNVREFARVAQLRFENWMG